MPEKMLLGNKISLRREIPDSRMNECLAIKYPRALPLASVVICFVDEVGHTISVSASLSLLYLSLIGIVSVHRCLSLSLSHFSLQVWSALFRTVWSVLDRSNPKYLKEIIIVNDASEVDWLTEVDPHEDVPVQQYRI